MVDLNGTAAKPGKHRQLCLLVAKLSLFLSAVLHGPYCPGDVIATGHNRRCGYGVPKPPIYLQNRPMWFEFGHRRIGRSTSEVIKYKRVKRPTLMHNRQRAPSESIIRRHVGRSALAQTGRYEHQRAAFDIRHRAAPNVDLGQLSTAEERPGAQAIRHTAKRLSVAPALARSKHVYTVTFWIKRLMLA